MSAVIYDAVCFFDAPATTHIYTLSLHDALPICYEILRRDSATSSVPIMMLTALSSELGRVAGLGSGASDFVTDRKSTRLNSSHANISYAVFCLKKKNIREVFDLRDYQLDRRPTI